MRESEFHVGLRDPEFRERMGIDLTEQSVTNILQDPLTLRLWYEHTARAQGFRPEPKASIDQTNIETAATRPRRPMSGGTKFMIASPFLIVIAGLIGYSNTVAGSDPNRNNNEFAAILACESAVKANLKTPSVAEFDSTAVRGVSWSVSGVVDSQNSFGAMIQTTFACTVDIDGGTATATITAIG